MATRKKYNKKSNKRSNVSKCNKLHKKTNKRHRKKKGGCGCESKIFSGFGSNNSTTNFIGQNQEKVGGSENLPQLYTKYFYPYNQNIINDPQNPSAQMDKRLLRYFSVSRGKRNKMKKGGANAFNGMYTQYINSGSKMDPITSFGSVNGATSQANTITGITSTTSTSQMDHPILTNPFGPNNPYLV